MSNENHHSRILAAIIGLIALGLAAATSAVAQSSYSYLPTASPADGRFLAVAGAGYNTITGDTIYVALSSPGDRDSLDFGIFDGETGGHWDQGNAGLTYKLYADSLGTGSGNALVGTWGGDSMTNNGWYNLRVRNSASALTTNGTYLYTLKIHSSDPGLTTLSAFKLRVDGAIALLPNQSFNFIAPLASTAEAGIIYPDYPSLMTSTYDGSWTFWLDVPAHSSSLTIYDGDMDFGNYTADTVDNNDQDSPSSVPSWAASTSARSEGVAAGDTTGGVTTRTGYPADNSRFSIFQRGGVVKYDVYTPNNTRFGNANPSGNLEWEQFKLSTSTFNASTMDYHADSLPRGLYKVQVAGMDMGNQNSWRFSYHVLGVDTTGDPDDPTVFDVTPPTVSMALDNEECWPPNHRLRTFTVSISALDDRFPNCTIVLDTVFSNEPDEGTGDGDTENDIQGATIGICDTVFQFRCERSGNDSGRVYTARYKAIDSAGNVTYVEGYVTVPHDQGNKFTAGSLTSKSMSVGYSYPNPFTTTTTARYDIKAPANVTLTVYTVTGEEVRALQGGWREAGRYSTQWDGRDGAGNVVPAGNYILHVGSGDCNCGENIPMVFLGAER